MNQKELSEIKRRINLKKTNINYIYGWYVNTNKEIITAFHESLGMMNETLSEQYLSLLKKSLSGALNKNLIDMEFSVAEVENSPEHKLLMEMRKTELKDAASRENFVEKIVKSLEMEEKYLILLAYDTYDVPYYGKDGESFSAESDEVFSYIICSVCPVKETTPALCYNVQERKFENHKESYICLPEMGFLFPTFDDRRGNIYNALFYSKKPSPEHPEFIDTVFNVKPPMLQPEQKECFEEALAEIMEGPCDYEILQNLHEKTSERVSVYKESKEPQPFTMSADDLGDLLQDSGVDDVKVKTFRQKCEESFGKSAELIPTNIIESKKFVVNTPDVVINVKPEKSYLIEAGTVMGKKYIMVNAEEGIEVNGINAEITKKYE